MKEEMLELQVSMSTAERSDRSLGAIKMPEGYALMKTENKKWYFLKWDGEYSEQTSRMQAYKWAKQNYDWDNWRESCK